MKHRLLITVILILMAIGGGVAGWKRGEWRERRAVQRADEERKAKQRLIGDAVARQIRESDEVEISFQPTPGAAQGETHFHDPVWVKQVAAVLEKAPYESHGWGLWVSMPNVECRTKGRSSLQLMWGRASIKVASPSGGGEFFVGEQTVSALKKLVADKMPES